MKKEEKKMKKEKTSERSTKKIGQRSSMNITRHKLDKEKVSETGKSTSKKRSTSESKTDSELPGREVTSLLMMTEYNETEGLKKEDFESSESSSSEDESSDESDDFEDVSEDESASRRDSVRKHRANISSKGLDIRVGQALRPKVVKKLSKIRVDFECARQELNRRLNVAQVHLHCIHSLCLIARIQYLNRLSDDPHIRAVILSLELDQFVPKKFNLNEKSLTDFVRKFASEYEFDPVVDIEVELFTPEAILELIVSKKKTSNPEIYTFVCFAVLKEILRNKNWLDSIRLCYVLEPVNLKTDFSFTFINDDQDLMGRPSLTTKPVNNERPFPKKNKSQHKPFKLWFEVYVEKPTKCWLPIEPINKLIGSESEIENSLSYPPYILAINQHGKLCEVTQRYCSIFFEPKFRKIRAEDFWNDTLRKLGAGQPTCEGERHEQQLFEEESAQVPFPTTLSGFKDHPLFVLDRHLLKYEAIYPKDTPPLGEFRGASIYPRKNVHITHSRDYWKREARVVRADQEPYKMSTARPKWDKHLRDYIRDLPQELFGIWQTDPYDPPQAKDGIVPRNEFGNVDLFKPEMLPKGCVHLKLNGLLKVANKLGIDCSPAVTGFDVKNRGTIPALDGFVVCQEFEQVLISAWEEEQLHRVERERQRYLGRVFKNWKKLIGLARARIRIKERYKDELE